MSVVEVVALISHITVTSSLGDDLLVGEFNGLLQDPLSRESDGVGNLGYRLRPLLAAMNFTEDRVTLRRTPESFGGHLNLMLGGAADVRGRDGH